MIVKAGSWFSLGDQRIGQGRANSLEWLAQHTVEREDLLQRAMADLSVSPALASVEALAA